MLATIQIPNDWLGDGAQHWNKPSLNLQPRFATQEQQQVQQQPPEMKIAEQLEVTARLLLQAQQNQAKADARVTEMETKVDSMLTKQIQIYDELYNVNQDVMDVRKTSMQLMDDTHERMCSAERRTDKIEADLANMKQA